MRAKRAVNTTTVNNMQTLELERDLLLEDIEDINAQIYSEIKAIETLKHEYDLAVKEEAEDNRFKLTDFN